MASITDAVLTATSDPTQPMLTFYDDRSGERTELSALTLGNWAAKTANLLRDELGLAPGDEIVVDLPEHWQTAAVLLGAWWAGVTVVPGDGDARAVFTTADRLDEHPDAEEVVAVPLDPFGMGIADLPLGVVDFGPAVRIHGDGFTPGGTGDGFAGTSADDVLAAARTAAATAGIAAGDRVLSTRPWRDADDITANLLGPLVAGASLVAVAHPDEAKLADRTATERATLTLA
ncbi:MAG: TIGR03089 family protein [Gordonia sp. (in: high G+C Gram-positive bacteria)]|uniref:TIGR03089 family protein n=1 Tax=Gordonia sp. (in: high G+C Gram-positive bacteria) TaxID=84139 RepID=UPI0039E2924B